MDSEHKIMITIDVPTFPLFNDSTDIKFKTRVAAMKHAFDVEVTMQHFRGWFNNQYHLVVQGPERNVRNFESAVQRWQQLDYQ